MKKLMAMGLLALSLAFLSQERASAWVNCKFGVGLNWNWQSGGNNFLWGAFRNGQPPGPEVAYPGHGPAYGHPPQGQTFPGINPYGPYDFQYFGGATQNNGVNAAGQTPQTPPPQVPTSQQNVSWNGGSVYQPVSYNPAAAYYGYPGYYNYYYPTQGYYGSYQAPSCWHNR